MLNEIMQNLQTVDTNTLSQTMLSSLTSSMGSMISSLIPLILDVIILALMRCPLYGLRFVPIYGKYYFYKSLIPHKKALAILQIIFSFIISFVLVFYVVFLVAALFGGLVGYDIGMEHIIALTFIVIVLGIVSFIINLMLNFALAETLMFKNMMTISRFTSVDVGASHKIWKIRLIEQACVGKEQSPKTVVRCMIAS